MTEVPDSEQVWTVEDCGGYAGGCPECTEIYRNWCGGVTPICMLCGGKHWAYEPHRVEPDDGEAT